MPADPGDTAADRVSRPALVAFSLGSLGTGIYSITPSVLLLYFMTDVLGIAAGLAAIAVSLPKFWDVITDPLMGTISDRTRSRWGRRRPYLLVGAFLMSITFVFLFSVPESLSTMGRFWYVLIVFTLSATAYTVFAVPYVAMPAEMSTDPHERTVIMSYRMGFALGGLLIGATIAPLLVEHFGGGQTAYAKMSYVIGAFCAGTMLAAFYGSRRLPATSPADTAMPVMAQIRSGLANRPFFVLMGAYIIQIAGIASFLAAAPYFVVYVSAARPSEAGFIFLGLMTSGLISMPFWTFLARRIGKLNSYMTAAVSYAALSACTLTLDPSVAEGAIRLLVTAMGIPFGCIMMMPFSMLTDTIEYDNLRTGLRREGVFTGMWTAGEKCGLALGPMMAGLVLSASGFVEAADGVQSAQSERALLGIKVAFSVIPAVLVFSSLALLWRYRIPSLQRQQTTMKSTGT